MTPQLPDLGTNNGDLMFLLGILFNQQIRAEAAGKPRLG
jgi:Uma2 family endonuclease